LLCQYLTEGCTRQQQSSDSSVSFDGWFEHLTTRRERLGELWEVCQWVQAIVLNGETVGEYLVVVRYYFSTCNPSLDQDAVLSDFAEDEVVISIVPGAYLDGGVRVLG
jgi:hypothetical protein